MLCWMLAGFVFGATDLWAQDSPLELSTRSEVTGEGRVAISLTLKNTTAEPLYHLHPMFHFHHLMSPMPMIHRLGPGQSVTLENKKHPPVRRIGSYPIVAMVSYKELEGATQTRTRVHTDSFYFEEPMVSQIEGSLDVVVDEETSIVKVFLKNPSPSLKDVQLMLLLPPELKADGFQGVKGLTLQSGAEKYFEVAVNHVAGLQGGVYPIHLMVEYGEKLRHFSGDLRSQIYFGPIPGAGPFWPQLLVFAFLAVTLFRALQKRFKFSRIP